MEEDETFACIRVRYWLRDVIMLLDWLRGTDLGKVIGYLKDSE